MLSPNAELSRSRRRLGTENAGEQRVSHTDRKRKGRRLSAQARSSVSFGESQNKPHNQHDHHHAYAACHAPNPVPTWLFVPWLRISANTRGDGAGCNRTAKIKTEQDAKKTNEERPASRRILETR